MRSGRLVVFARSLGFALGVAITSSAAAQEVLTAPLNSHDVPSHVDSGPVANEGAELRVVFSTTVAAPGAAWIRLNFDQVLLAGDESAGDESFLVVTSMLDGAYQYLNARHVREWRNTSAYLNGDMARIELYAHPGTGPNRLRMSRLTAGGALHLRHHRRSAAFRRSARRPRPAGRLHRLADQRLRALFPDRRPLHERALGHRVQRPALQLVGRAESPAARGPVCGRQRLGADQRRPGTGQ